MTPQPVSAIAHAAARALRELGEQIVTGTVRKASRSGTGNGYVTIEDESGACLRVHLQARLPLALPEVGDVVVVRGLLRVYVATSDVQIDAVEITKGGE